jgi:hypothetical protein
VTQTFLWWANVATDVHERYQSFFPEDVRYVADHAKRAMSTFPLRSGRYYGVDYGARGEKGCRSRDAFAGARRRAFRDSQARASPHGFGWRGTNAGGVWGLAVSSKRR